jgi:RHS repeat-associated protein
MFTYNRDGSATSIQNAEIEYHKYNRMPVAVNGTLLRYNSHGMRIRKGDRIYRGYGKEIVETGDGGEICFIISPNGLIYIHSGETRMPVSRNRQQSVCSFGSSLLYYSPFGEFASYGNLPRRLYTGYEYDSEWDMYNARKRLYSQKLRNFISVDPKFQFASPYLYCMSDPFNSIDPTGEMSTGTIVNLAINAAMIVASIVVAVLTWGAATPAVAAADDAVVAAEAEINAIAAPLEETTEEFARVELALARDDLSPVQRSFIGYRSGILFGRRRAMADRIAASRAVLNNQRNVLAAAKPARLDAVTKNVGKVAAVGMLASGPATLTAKEASGEHISSSEAINDMLIQPAVAILGMGVGVGVGMGIIKAAAAIADVTFAQASKMLATRLLSYTIGAASGAFTSGVVSSAANKENMGSGKTWENIGIGVGVAAGVAFITAGAPSAKNGIVKAGRSMAERFNRVEESSHSLAEMSPADEFPESHHGILDPDDPEQYEEWAEAL